jgi:D-glycero-alpha-D-manno-heptose 1-phosphate guanylyltransferase
MNEAIVLAGGLGSRLAPVIADRPKPMAPVAGRPFLEWQLDYLASQGVRRVVLSVGHLAEQIIDHFGSRFGDLDLDYSREATALGTGGAIRRALGRVNGPGAFVTNGDTLLLADLPLLAPPGDPALVMAVQQVLDRTRFGAVDFDGARVVGFRAGGETGPGWVNAGIYRVARDIFSGFALPEAFSFERDFLAAHVARVRPVGVAVDAYFVDIGDPAAYVGAQLGVPAAWKLRFTRQGPDQPMT